MACSELARLLCADEVAAALGAQVRPPTCLLLEPSSRAGRICLWRSSGGRGWLTLATFTGPLAAHAVRMERRAGRPVPGLGDEGYLRGGLVCVVRCGERVLKLVLSGSRAHDPAAGLVRLAGLAAVRLRQAGGPEPSATAPESPR
ncbi:MAG TPA: hypothetical protein VFA45_15690 [Actinomycetes bacterium]|jgi:hypothetical protein|nr:hypothetical protein [Actinomycetes bacterium]